MKWRLVEINGFKRLLEGKIDTLGNRLNLQMRACQGLLLGIDSDSNISQPGYRSYLLTENQIQFSSKRA